MGIRGLLIGGSSHCGKSTLARRVGESLGWRITSTGKLGRHPGRPWLDVPAPVEEFYDALTDDTIYWFLRVHHTNFWPLLARTIADEKALGGGFVLEGSALRPETVLTLDDPDVVYLCLHANPDFLFERMRRESGYDDREAGVRKRIDKFITRALRDNQERQEAAEARGFPSIDVADASGLERATGQLIQQLQH